MVFHSESFPGFISAPNLMHSPQPMSCWSQGTDDLPQFFADLKTSFLTALSQLQPLSFPLTLLHQNKPTTVRLY